MFKLLLRLVLALGVLAIAGQQLLTYFNIVVAGSYMSTAPFYQMIITGLLWPVVVVIVAIWLLRVIFTFKPEHLN